VSLGFDEMPSQCHQASDGFGFSSLIAGLPDPNILKGLRMETVGIYCGHSDYFTVIWYI
jgi:hypothetical protein